MAQDPRIVVQAVTANAQVITGAREDYHGLMLLIGDSRFVLLGEASHGTHDFYETRGQPSIRRAGRVGVRCPHCPRLVRSIS